MRDLIILFLSFVYSIIQSQEINYHQIEPIGLLEPYNSISFSRGLLAINDTTVIFCCSNVKYNRNIVIKNSKRIQLNYATPNTRKFIFFSIDLDSSVHFPEMSQSSLFYLKNNEVAMYYNGSIYFYYISTLDTSFEYFKKIKIKTQKLLPLQVNMLGFYKGNLLLQIVEKDTLYCADTSKCTVFPSEMIFEKSSIAQYYMHKNIAMNKKSNLISFTKLYTNETTILNTNSNKTFHILIDSLSYIDTSHSFTYEKIFCFNASRSRIVSEFFINDSLLCLRFAINNGSLIYACNYYYKVTDTVYFIKSELDYPMRVNNYRDKSSNDYIISYTIDFTIENSILFIVHYRAYYKKGSEITFGELEKIPSDGYYKISRYEIHSNF